MDYRSECSAVSLDGTPDLAAQAKPSLAGTWILETDSNGLGGLGRALNITQDSDTLTIEYTTIGANPVLRTLVYRIGGNDEQNTIVWSGNTLIATTRIATGERKYTFQLEGGKLVVNASTPGFGPAPSRIVYKKAP